MKQYTLRKLALAALFVVLMLAIETSTLKFLGMGGKPLYWLFDLSCICVFALLFFMLPFKAQNILNLALLLITGILCYTTICVYASTGMIFQWDQLKLLSETKGALSMAIFPRPPLVCILLFIAIYVLIWIFCRKVKKPSYSLFVKTVISSASIVLLAIMVAITGITNNKILKNYEQITYFTSDSYDYATFSSPYVALNKFGLFGYYGVDLARKIIPSITPKVKVSPEDFAFDTYTTILKDLCKDQNILFILGESVDTYVITKELTPVLYALKNGYDLSSVGITSFYNVSTNISGEKELTRKDFDYNGTSYDYNGTDIYAGLEAGVCGIDMTNMYSYENTQKAEDRILTGNGISYQNSMPQIFRSAGYETNYMHCNGGYYYGREKIMPNYYGFKNTAFYEDMEHFLPKTEHLNMLTLDSLAVNHFLASSEEFNFIPEEKFFSFFMTVTAHGDYLDLADETMLSEYYAFFDSVIASPASDMSIDVYRTLEDGLLKEAIRNFYCKTLDTERVLALLVNELFETGKLDETIIAFSADHYSYAADVVDYKELYYKANYGAYGLTEVFKIPAFIYSTNITSDYLEEKGYSREVSHISSAYDMAPTLFSLTGVEFNQSDYLGYAFYNKSDTTGDELYNPFVYSNSNQHYFNENVRTYDGETFTSTYPLTDEQKKQFLIDINNFKLRQYYLSNTE